MRCVTYVSGPNLQSYTLQHKAWVSIEALNLSRTSTGLEIILGHALLLNLYDYRACVQCYNINNILQGVTFICLNIMTKLTPKFGSECCCKSKARYLLYNINVYCKKMYMSESISDPICLVFLCSSSKPISLLRLYKSISVVFFSSMCNLLIHYAMHTGNLFTVSLTMKVYHGY